MILERSVGLDTGDVGHLVIRKIRPGAASYRLEVFERDTPDRCLIQASLNTEELLLLWRAIDSVIGR